MYKYYGIPLWASGEKIKKKNSSSSGLRSGGGGGEKGRTHERSRRERKRKKRKGEKLREKDMNGDNDGGSSLRSACPKKKIYIYIII